MFRVEAGSGSRSGKMTEWSSSTATAPGARLATSRPRMGGAFLPVCPTESLGSPVPGLPRTTSNRPERGCVSGCSVRSALAVGAWLSRTSNRSALGCAVTVSAAVRSIENENK